MTKTSLLTRWSTSLEKRRRKNFGIESSVALTSDSISHKLAWKGQADLHQLQGRPIRLRFHLKGAKLYSITPGTRHAHYIQSYDQ